MVRRGPNCLDVGEMKMEYRGKCLYGVEGREDPVELKCYILF